MPTAPLTVIADRFEVGELLGRGGMAEVFAGEDRRLRRQVAIKFLRAEMAADPDIRSRFEAEARAAAALGHPHAVSVFDSGEENGVPFIVMERLPGETLADRIAEGPSDPAWIRQMSDDILGALAAAHEAGLVHRDVKPGNILITADGRAKIADFGIAKSLEAGDPALDLTGTGQLLGTPSYLAPERLGGAPATPQSDIYAVGVVMYQALTGAKPFDGPTPLAAAEAITRGVHVPLGERRPDLDPALVSTVERAMATDPAGRFGSAAAMKAALGAPDTADATVALPDGTMVLDTEAAASSMPATTTSPVDRRRRLSLAGIIVAGLAAILAIVLFAGAGADSTSPGAPGLGAAVTTVPASPERTLASAIRARAASLSPADGSFAPQVADRLNQVADAVEAGNGGPLATSLLAVVPMWNRTELLGDSATSSVVELLKQVPGVDLTPYNAITAATAPPATVGPATATDGEGEEEGGKRGKGKGKGDD